MTYPEGSEFGGSLPRGVSFSVVHYTDDDVYELQVVGFEGIVSNTYVLHPMEFELLRQVVDNPTEEKASS